MINQNTPKRFYLCFLLMYPKWVFLWSCSVSLQTRFWSQDIAGFFVYMIPGFLSRFGPNAIKLQSAVANWSVMIRRTCSLIFHTFSHHYSAAVGRNKLILVCGLLALLEKRACIWIKLRDKSITRGFIANAVAGEWVSKRASVRGNQQHLSAWKLFHQRQATAAAAAAVAAASSRSVSLLTLLMAFFILLI